MGHWECEQKNEWVWRPRDPSRDKRLKGGEEAPTLRHRWDFLRGEPAGIRSLQVVGGE